jgi:antitoxin ParD1/3/4
MVVEVECMRQDSMNVALPGTLKQFVLQQVTEAGYSTASEYIRELIRADQRRKAREALESRVLEGLETPSRELTPDDWQMLKRRTRQRQAKKKSR